MNTLAKKTRRIPRNSVTDLVKVLRERIAQHEYLPGAKLLENDIAGEFNVSRARVREAFGALESRGLIQRIPNRGAEVVRLDLAQMFAIYEVREILEGLCVRLAVQNSKPESWQDLVVQFGRDMERHVRNGEFEEYIGKLELVRRRTTEAARNPVLAEMLDSINDKTREIMRRIIILPGRAAEGLKQHRAVLAAMRKGDAALAEKLKRGNIRSSREFLERYQSFIL
ncbi:MAG: GntR family transcriptional regulator [Burkholderiales bacterium]|nr:GntR family transcriptional regulator [Burkholderiales bacterium]